MFVVSIYFVFLGLTDYKKFQSDKKSFTAYEKEKVKQFTDSSQTIEFKGLNTKEKYQWIGGFKEVQVSATEEKWDGHIAQIHRKGD